MNTTVTDDGEVIPVPHETVYTATQRFKTPFNHDRDLESLAFGLACKDPTKTQQHLAAEQDINNIVRKFMNTGDLPLTGTAQFMNIENLAELQDVIVTQHQVNEAWNALPASVRNILRDPRTFVDYIEHCLKNADLDPLRELGLANPKPPEPPIDPGPSPAPAPAAGGA